MSERSEDKGIDDGKFDRLGRIGKGPFLAGVPSVDEGREAFFKHVAACVPRHVHRSEASCTHPHGDLSPEERLARLQERGLPTDEVNRMREEIARGFWENYPA